MVSSITSLVTPHNPTSFSLSSFLSLRFRNQECALIKFRLERLTDTDREAFMKANNLTFSKVDAKERNELKEKLVGLCGVTNEVMLLTTTFYK